MSWNCFHCNQKINNKEERISIVRNNGLSSFNFHLICFEEVSGKEFIPEKSPPLDVDFKIDFIKTGFAERYSNYSIFYKPFPDDKNT